MSQERNPSRDKKDEEQEKISDFIRNYIKSLQNEKKNNYEDYIRLVCTYMKQCQGEYEDERKNGSNVSTSTWFKKWQLFIETYGHPFDPRNRLWTKEEFEHWPTLAILKRKDPDAFSLHMLRFRVLSAKGSEAEKNLVLQEIERYHHQQTERKQRNNQEGKCPAIKNTTRREIHSVAAAAPAAAQSSSSVAPTVAPIVADPTLVKSVSS